MGLSTKRVHATMVHKQRRANRLSSQQLCWVDTRYDPRSCVDRVEDSLPEARLPTARPEHLENRILYYDELDALHLLFLLKLSRHTRYLLPSPSTRNSSTQFPWLILLWM